MKTYGLAFVWSLLLAGTAVAGTKKVRPKHVVGEATMRGDQRNIDFGETELNGRSVGPDGHLITQSRADKNYDFVRVRLRWHPEMVKSAASLDAN